MWTDTKANRKRYYRHAKAVTVALGRNQSPYGYDLWSDVWYDDFDDTCHRCGGEGFVEYFDCPEEWGEDCPAEENHLIECPDCYGTGVAQ